MDEKTTTIETLEAALREYATAIASLISHTSVDHVHISIIEAPDGSCTYIDATCWGGEDKLINFDKEWRR